METTTIKRKPARSYPIQKLQEIVANPQDHPAEFVESCRLEIKIREESKKYRIKAELFDDSKIEHIISNPEAYPAPLVYRCQIEQRKRLKKAQAAVQEPASPKTTLNEAETPAVDNRTNTLWKKGTRMAYHGYVSQLVIGIAGTTILTLMVTRMYDYFDESFFIMYSKTATIIGIASFIAYIYYFFGISKMKQAAANTDISSGTNCLFYASIMAVAAIILSFITPIAFLISILNIGSLLMAWYGYKQISTKSANKEIKAGSRFLKSSMLLSFTATSLMIITNAISTGSWILSSVLEIAALIFAVKGWRDLAKSDLA